MFAFRTPISRDSISVLIAMAQQYYDCGAVIKIEHEIMYVGCMHRDCHEFFACLESRLSPSEIDELKHSIAAYDMEFNFNLDRLHEEKQMPKEQLIDEADRTTFAEVYDLPYLPDFE